MPSVPGELLLPAVAELSEPVLHDADGSQRSLFSINHQNVLDLPDLGCGALMVNKMVDKISRTRGETVPQRA